MASIVRVWLLLWMISDLMVFKTNAVENNEKVGDNHSVQENTTSQTDGIVLNLIHPNDRNHSSDVTNSTDGNETESKKEQNGNYSTTTTKTPSDSIDKPLDTETTSPAPPSNTTDAPLIPTATVEPTIQHKLQTQSKIIIRYAGVNCGYLYSFFSVD